MTPALSTAERDALLDGLESSNEEVRRLAVEQLVCLPSAEAVERLVAALADPSWRVRKTAVEGLGAHREAVVAEPRPIAALVAALADGENPGRRNAAFEVFVALGSRALPPLVEATRSDDVDVRKLAVDALARIADPSAAGVLSALLADPDPNVRGASADALGALAGGGEIASLLGVATREAEVPLVRLSALRALERLEASVSVLMLDQALGDAQLRPAALALLGHSTDPAALFALEKALGSPQRAVCEAAMGAWLGLLARCDGEQVDALCERLRTVADAALVPRACEGLRSEDRMRRGVSIQLLAILGDDRAVRPLLEAGRDESVRDQVDAALLTLGGATVRALRREGATLEADLLLRATILLGRIGGEAAEAFLGELLSRPSVATAACAARALAECAGPPRLAELVRRLEQAARAEAEESAELVESLIGAIVQIAERCPVGERPVVHVQLIELLGSRLGGAPIALRVVIARVLARIGSEQDAERIEHLLRDASPLVRRAAVEALARFGLERMRGAMRLALADEANGVRIAATDVLARVDSPEVLEDLARLAGDGDARVAAAALRATARWYGQFGREAGGTLAWLGTGAERDPQIALAALETLTQVGGAIAVATAERALGRSEPEVVRAAVVCLARHAPAEALGRLVELVGHPDWSVRAEVVDVLAARRHRRALPALLRRIDAEEDPFVREALLSATRSLEP